MCIEHQTPASFSGCMGGEKTAWYPSFVHAHPIQKKNLGIHVSFYKWVVKFSTLPTHEQQSCVGKPLPLSTCMRSTHTDEKANLAANPHH